MCIVAYRAATPEICNVEKPVSFFRLLLPASDKRNCIRVFAVAVERIVSLLRHIFSDVFTGAICRPDR
jgi:hypothetical protein